MLEFGTNLFYFVSRNLSSSKIMRENHCFITQIAIPPERPLTVTSLKLFSLLLGFQWVIGKERVRRMKVEMVLFWELKRRKFCVTFFPVSNYLSYMFASSLNHKNIFFTSQFYWLAWSLLLTKFLPHVVFSFLASSTLKF